MDGGIPSGADTPLPGIWVKDEKTIEAKLEDMKQIRSLCIATPKAPQQTETFIRAHIEKLPFSVSSIFAFEEEFRTGGGEPITLKMGNAERVMDIALNLLPRFLEFRVRRRMERADAALRSTQALAAFLLRNKVDAVLAEYGTTGCFVADACVLANVPLIAHFHGFDASRRTTIEAFARRYQDMFAIASKIVAVSHEMKRDIVSLGCPQDKIVVNHYGPNPGFLTLAPDISKQHIVSVGRLTAKKAPHLLLLAFARISSEFPEATLTIIGDGELLSVCRDLRDSLGLSSKVNLAGAGSVEQVQAEFSRSSIYAQHSVTAADGDKEGTPVAILEACAAGLPVVSTRHAGIVDVVADRVSGYLVAEGDVVGMSVALGKLLSNQSERQRMGEAGRRIIRESFTMERHLRVLSEIIFLC